MLQRQCNDSAADSKVRTVAPESQGQQQQLSRRKTLLILKPRVLLLLSHSNLQQAELQALIKQNAFHSCEHLFIRVGTNGIKVSGCLLFWGEGSRAFLLKLGCFWACWNTKIHCKTQNHVFLGWTGSSNGFLLIGHPKQAPEGMQSTERARARFCSGPGWGTP